MPGGPRCHYKLPPLYNADMKLDPIAPANKKAIDLYMLGVLIYRALLGVPFPYASKDVITGSCHYSFKPLDIIFPRERLELMGWTLEEVQGAKALLEGLLHVDPAKQMKIEDVVAHNWLARDPALHKFLISPWGIILLKEKTNRQFILTHCSIYLYLMQFDKPTLSIFKYIYIFLIPNSYLYITSYN